MLLTPISVGAEEGVIEGSQLEGIRVGDNVSGSAGAIIASIVEYDDD